MQDGYKVTLNLTIGSIPKMRLENHLRLLLRFNLLFRLRQDSQAHHTEAEEKEKS